MFKASINVSKVSPNNIDGHNGSLLLACTLKVGSSYSLAYSPVLVMTLNPLCRIGVSNLRNYHNFKVRRLSFLTARGDCT